MRKWSKMPLWNYNYRYINASATIALSLKQNIADTNTPLRSLKEKEVYGDGINY